MFLEVLFLCLAKSCFSYTVDRSKVDSLWRVLAENKLVMDLLEDANRGMFHLGTFPDSLIEDAATRFYAGAELVFESCRAANLKLFVHSKKDSKIVFSLAQNFFMEAGNVSLLADTDEAFFWLRMDFMRLIDPFFLDSLATGLESVLQERSLPVGTAEKMLALVRASFLVFGVEKAFLAAAFANPQPPAVRLKLRTEIDLTETWMASRAYSDPAFALPFGTGKLTNTFLAYSFPVETQTSTASSSLDSTTTDNSNSSASSTSTGNTVSNSEQDEELNRLKRKEKDLRDQVSEMEKKERVYFALAIVLILLSSFLLLILLCCGAVVSSLKKTKNNKTNRSAKNVVDSPDVVKVKLG